MACYLLWNDRQIEYRIIEMLTMLGDIRTEIEMTWLKNSSSEKLSNCQHRAFSVLAMPKHLSCNMYYQSFRIFWGHAHKEKIF